MVKKKRLPVTDNMRMPVEFIRPASGSRSPAEEQQEGLRELANFRHRMEATDARQRSLDNDETADASSERDSYGKIAKPVNAGAKGLVAAGMEMRRLLTDVIGFGDLLQRGDHDDQKRAEYWGKVSSASREMWSIIHGMLIGTVVEDPARSDATELISRAIVQVEDALRSVRKAQAGIERPELFVDCNGYGSWHIGYGNTLFFFDAKEALTFLAALLRRELDGEKTLPRNALDMLHLSPDYMSTDGFLREFAEVARYLSAEQRAKTLERARNDARVGRFLAEINASSDRPMLRKDCPQDWDLPTFLTREWRAKGWIRPDVDLQMVEAYDPGLPRLIGMWEGRKGLLPPELRFKKARNKASAAERKVARRIVE